MVNTLFLLFASCLIDTDATLSDVEDFGVEGELFNICVEVSAVQRRSI